MSPNHQSGMTFTKFFPSDWRSGCLPLNLEEEGLYIRACMFHYDTGRALPDNDAEASRLLNVQIQKYQKVMRSLIDKGKMVRAQGILFNERVVEEIDKYRLTLATRSEAARKREERKAQMQREIEAAMAKKAPPQVPPEVPQGVPPHQPPYQPPLGRSGVPTPVPHEVDAKKLNEINESEAQEKQGKSSPWISRSQKPESRSHIESKQEDAGELAGLNGSVDPMLKDILAWMPGGDVANARDWLSRMIQINGPDVVKNSYQKLVTDITTGSMVSKPLQTWGKIATRMRDEPAPPRSAPTESRRERIRRMAEETEAQIRGRRA